MRTLIAAGIRVQSIVTSPPYWGLRDYGVAGQLGQEPTMREFIANMVEVFDLCRELLADDGTLWLNMGDSYASTGGPTGPMTGAQFINRQRSKAVICLSNRKAGQEEGLKPKDLVGQPWRLAFALQDAGWWLRQDIIWHKPNPMPESVRDRCTKAHEYLFLMAKSDRYYFDQDSIRTPFSPETKAQSFESMDFKQRDTYRSTGNVRPAKGQAAYESGDERHRTKAGLLAYAEKTRADGMSSGGANRRSVWTVPTTPYPGAHFATFPEALVEPCILAGSRPGDIVFDPFMGSGTVASVAQRLGRRWLGAELNPEYIALQADRTRQLGLVLEVA
ncbi:DNA-methyltransferase [Ralstonia mannitolilytica]|uniref:DNA-methyltransferase n=1 Tax=Ralstonia mannitolilytica TaxID=105219 RepID=UPI0007AFEBAA|nr:site-specific DNA-methyltransferase [Ralstonia mannitolilytica]ANA34994.1 DNA methyltransferase [Ralstonia mannitolilytica]